MTLHLEPPPPAAPRPEMQGIPPLVARLKKPPRVPRWYWLRHPWRAWWVTQLIREAFRWRDILNTQPNALTWAEKLLFERAQRTQKKAIATIATKVDNLADEYQALRAQAVRERTLATLERQRPVTPPTNIHVYAAGPMSVAEAKDVIAKCQQRIADDTARGQTRHQERPSKIRNGTSAGLLIVDVAALLALIAKFFNVTLANALNKLPETIATVGFSLIASLVLALLAHTAGQAAGHLRAVSGRNAAPHASDDQATAPPAQEFPPARLMLYIKLVSLFVVSAMVGISVATRIIQPSASVNTGPLGVLIGTLVGLTAFLAPWQIVMNLMRSGSLETRTIDVLTAMVCDIDATASAHAKTAIHADQQAEQARQSAQRARTTELESAMNMTATTRQIVELARSFHTDAGRYAIADNTPVDGPYVSMQTAIATDTSAIDSALRRFDLADGVLRQPGAKSEDGDNLTSE